MGCVVPFLLLLMETPLLVHLAVGHASNELACGLAAPCIVGGV